MLIYSDADVFVHILDADIVTPSLGAAVSKHILDANICMNILDADAYDKSYKLIVAGLMCLFSACLK